MAGIRTRDLSRRHFWTVPTDLQDVAVRLNVEGREPHGKIRPEDFAAVCSQLRTDLLDLRDPDTGAAVVAEVVFAHDRGEDPSTQDVADLHVIAAGSGTATAAVSPRVGEVRVDPRHKRPGNHRPGGWFIAAGPGIEPGVREEGGSLVDIAPTVASLLGETGPWLGRSLL
jgi:predicted AlkP superfamily phosphohydrolase/phosphomutase